MIDRDGYRPNVGIILANDEGKVLWARRSGQSAWQFPQGGIKRHETPEQALYRELHEELGLEAQSVDVVGSTQDWLRYDLPKRYVRRHSRPLCVGQKQVWFLLKFLDRESAFKLDTSAKPEFDSWRWVNYWHPTREVVAFKRNVYKLALRELAPLFYANVSPQGRESPGPSPCESRSGSGH